MDTNTVDGRFAQLQQQAEGTASLVQALATKLSAAAATDGSAREWALDLREIALAVRDEQTTTTELLQSIHALVDEHVQQTPAMPAYPPPVTYTQPQQYQPQCSTHRSRRGISPLRVAERCSISSADASGRPSCPVRESASATTSSNRLFDRL